VRDRLLRALGDPEDTVVGHAASDEALGLALLAGYGDRVAKRRRPGSDQLVLAGGGSAVQSESSVVRAAPLCVVLDAREQRGRVIAHLVSAIEPEWLLELFPDRVQDVEEVVFDEARERVELSRGLRYGGVMLDESRGGEPDPQRAAAVLADVVLARGLERVADMDAVERFERRVAHAARISDAAEPLPEDARKRALRAACMGCRTLSDVDGQGLLGAMQGLLSGEQLAALQRLAPEQVALPSGRKLRVHYEPDRPPWVASRLQDFFGSADGPRLGIEPLVLHLLAPNQRAVQVTTDLAGFWTRHYPELRKQLMRRYPKHAWPEDPLTAAPPKPGGRRRR
jgi:ATP-dependent helicase HrpB